VVIGDGLAASPIVFVSETAAHPVSGDSEPEAVTAVVLGSSTDRVRLRSKAPFKASLVTADGRPRLRLEPAAPGPLALQLGVQVSFTEERIQAQSLFLEAEKDERDMRIGEAITKYRAILKDFPFNEKVTGDAEKRARDLETRVEREDVRLSSALAEALFFQLPPLLERVRADAENVARVYAGTKGGAEALEKAKRAGEALAAIAQKKAEAQATAELERAKDLQATGASTLAEIVLRDIAERYAGTSASAQAKEALASVKR
jgi:hypothetical protein